MVWQWLFAQRVMFYKFQAMLRGEGAVKGGAQCRVAGYWGMVLEGISVVLSSCCTHSNPLTFLDYELSISFPS